MQDVFLLEAIATRDKSTAKELINLLDLTNVTKEFHNSKYALKMATYSGLYRLHKSGFINREHDATFSHKNYRFTISEKGFDFLLNQTDLNLVKTVMEKMS